jgi:Putative zinc-finger
MCDFSGRLILWLDQELPFDEAADVTRHVESCDECQRDLNSFKQVTGTFEALCDAALASTERRRLPRWVWTAGTKVAVTAAAALLLALPRAPIKEPAARPPVAVAAAASLSEPAPTLVDVPVDVPAKKTHRPRALAPAPVQPVRSQQNANWVQSEPAIRIVIPAEAIFAPGAVPEGITLFADVTIAADGSAQRLRLRP